MKKTEMGSGDLRKIAWNMCTTIISEISISRKNTFHICLKLVDVLLVVLVISECFPLAIASRLNPVKTNRKNPEHPVIMEQAFINAGEKAGLEVWRIENFKPVKYPKENYGIFYKGDSYIVLMTKINKANDKSWNIHFWLGSETSQDEAGTAAIFAVTLDTQLGGEPVQYREVESHESDRFISYFKDGVKYLSGGIISGFTHVDRDAVTKRFFHVKGKRNVRVKEVDVSIASMNRGDCFVLDAGKEIYVYVGRNSKRMERFKANSVATQIRDKDHAGKGQLLTIDMSSSDSDYQQFFDALGGGSKESVPEGSTSEDDEAFEAHQLGIVTLYSVAITNGKVAFTELPRPIKQEQLKSDDCFVLDTVDSNVFVWVGKKCDPKEREHAMAKGQEFISTKNYPKWTQVRRLIEGGETTDFVQYFAQWKWADEAKPRLIRSVSTTDQSKVVSTLEPRLFHAQIIEKGGKLQLEEVLNYKQDDLVDDDIMLLDSGNRLFIWIGQKSSVEEKADASRLATAYLTKTNRNGIPNITVAQYAEPEAFIAAFPEWK